MKIEISSPGISIIVEMSNMDFRMAMGIIADGIRKNEGVLTVQNGPAFKLIPLSIFKDKVVDIKEV